MILELDCGNSLIKWRVIEGRHGRSPVALRSPMMRWSNS